MENYKYLVTLLKPKEYQQSWIIVESFALHAIFEDVEIESKKISCDNNNYGYIEIQFKNSSIIHLYDCLFKYTEKYL